MGQVEVAQEDKDGPAVGLRDVLVRLGQAAARVKDDMAVGGPDQDADRGPGIRFEPAVCTQKDCVQGNLLLSGDAGTIRSRQFIATIYPPAGV